MSEQQTQWGNCLCSHSLDQHNGACLVCACEHYYEAKPSAPTPPAPSSEDRLRPMEPFDGWSRVPGPSSELPSNEWHLNEKQVEAAKQWAADDRLWTTQEAVEFNLKTFARVILSHAENNTDNLRKEQADQIAALTRKLEDREPTQQEHVLALMRVRAAELKAEAAKATVAERDQQLATRQEAAFRAGYRASSEDIAYLLAALEEAQQALKVIADSGTCDAEPEKCFMDCGLYCGEHGAGGQQYLVEVARKALGLDASTPETP